MHNNETINFRENLIGNRNVKYANKQTVHYTQYLKEMYSNWDFQGFSNNANIKAQKHAICINVVFISETVQSFVINLLNLHSSVLYWNCIHKYTNSKQRHQQY